MKRISLLSIAFLILCSLSIILSSCKSNTVEKSTCPECLDSSETAVQAGSPIPVIFDTDANNELDDQHALAYLLLNEETFHTIGVTVNATRNGGEIGEHMKEADRVVRLVAMQDKIPVIAGANASFPEIKETVDSPEYDGHEAVDFIIREAVKDRDQQLVLLAVGKLTNIALALLKEPAIAEKVRVVWLGANYPRPGEYNLVDDTASVTFVLSTSVPFEMVTVRYGEPSGTAAVKVSKAEIEEKMPGLGPQISEQVTGRHGGKFSNFGDYSVSLFRHAEFYDKGEHRSLFDMAAVAIVKDSSWAESLKIPCPAYVRNQWVEQPENERMIQVWENFDRDAIMEDFYQAFL